MRLINMDKDILWKPRLMKLGLSMDTNIRAPFQIEELQAYARLRHSTEIVFSETVIVKYRHVP